MQRQTLYQYLHGCIVTAYDYEIPAVKLLVELAFKNFSLTVQEHKMLGSSMQKRIDSVSTVDNLHLLTQEMTQ